MPFDYDLRFDGHPVTAHNLSNGPVEDLSIVLYDRLDGRELRIDFNGNPRSYSPTGLPIFSNGSEASDCRCRSGPAIGSLDILAPAERRHDPAGVERHRARDPAATLPELFAAQVARTRTRLRRYTRRRRLTYGELDARSSQLAHHLRALGVGPEVVVGLCVERSLEMLVALLGILKAGGAYLPLDPDYPPERLAFMLAGRRARRCW